MNSYSPMIFALFIDLAVIQRCFVVKHLTGDSTGGLNKSNDPFRIGQVGVPPRFYV